MSILKPPKIAFIIFLHHSKVGLVTLAMQGDTCTSNRIDFKRILAVAYNISENEVISRYGDLRHLPKTPIFFTEDQLKTIEDDLNKYHISERVQRTTKILRGPQTATPQDLESSLVSWQFKRRQKKHD